MKRIAKILLALVLAFGVLSFAPVAKANDDEGQLGDLYWYFNDNESTLYISGRGDMPECDHYPWEHIAHHVRVVYVEDEVTSIAEGAFAGLDLHAVFITTPYLEHIERYAFGYNTNLQFVFIQNFRNNLERYVYDQDYRDNWVYNGNEHFFHAKWFCDYRYAGLNQWDTVAWVVEGNKMTVAGTGALTPVTAERYLDFPWTDYTQNWRLNITKLYIEEGITEIKDYAFRGSFFTEVHLPSTIEIIGTNAFDDCRELNDVFYNDTREAADAIEIYSNYELLHATWHYVGFPPVITRQPVGFIGSLGAAARFICAAEGEDLNFQWQVKYKGGQWQDMIGEIDPVLTFKIGLEHHQARFRCVISNPYGQVITREALLTINKLPKPDPKPWEPGVPVLVKLR